MSVSKSFCYYFFYCANRLVNFFSARSDSFAIHVLIIGFVFTSVQNVCAHVLSYIEWTNKHCRWNKFQFFIFSACLKNRLSKDFSKDFTFCRKLDNLFCGLYHIQKKNLFNTFHLIFFQEIFFHEWLIKLYVA